MGFRNKEKKPNSELLILKVSKTDTVFPRAHQKMNKRDEEVEKCYPPPKSFVTGRDISLVIF